MKIFARCKICTLFFCNLEFIFKMGKKKTSNKDGNIALDASKQEEFSEKAIATGETLITPGTMYIGHIPHGFYEDQIRAYFGQFGVVNKVRLARSKKTGGCKGYGYVQFANEDVAMIAADAMNNYLMFDKLLKCKFVPEDKLHPAIWKGANRKFVWRNPAFKEKAKHNKIRTKEQLAKSAKRLVQKERAKRKKLLELGIKYDFPGYEGAMSKKKNKSKEQNDVGKSIKKKKTV